MLEGNYDKGRLRIHLNGSELKGEWDLVRWRKEGKRDTWLIIKAAGTMRSVSKKRDDMSVLSGRSMRQIADAADAIWHSNRKAS